MSALPQPANQNFTLLDNRIRELESLDHYLSGVLSNLTIVYRKTGESMIGTIITQLPMLMMSLTESINELHRKKYGME